MGRSKQDSDKLPLHAHPNVCNSVLLDKVSQLSFLSADTQQHLIEALRWVNDPSRYDFARKKVKCQNYRPGLTVDDVNQLNRYGKFVFVAALCGVKSFSIPEWNKKRRRPIFWPDINALISKDMLQKSRIPLKDLVRKQVKKDSWSIQFDFKSWFDQIKLHMEISRFFAFKADMCLGQLPMGFRPAVEVAQAITLKLIDFQLPEGVEAIAYIDNVRFVGPSKEAVEAAGKEFKERCKEVGAIIGTEHEPSQFDDFLGEQYDHVNATRKITDKVMEKVNIARALVNNNSPITYRQLAAIFGVLFYASHVLDVSPAKYYTAMRFYREQMSQVNNWNDTCDSMPAAPRQNLLNWFAVLRNNKPTDAYTPPCEDEFDLTLYVDASDYGWGCVSIANHTTKILQGVWTESDRAAHKVASSVSSEPLGALRAIKATTSVNMKRVRIYTDHMGLVYAGNRGYGKARTYNDLLVHLEELYPNTKFEFVHIKGIYNPADKYSRPPNTC